MCNNKEQNFEGQQGRKCSLWQLTQENAIVIPIIQRDYAQGREKDDVRQIREPFLKKIFNVLGRQCSLELDFIYGTLEKPKDISLKNVDYENFVPLDGQQRLTTLFLLHWFLALWNEEDFNLMKEHFKGRFSYTTRLSSTEFCSELLEHICSQDVIRSITSPCRGTIRSFVDNEGWFHNQWKNDPTISGMLNMLDSMSTLFEEYVKPNDKEADTAHMFFHRLIGDNAGESAITFYLLYLNRGDFHLSDELYIKMNSRGRPLSDFETFKARFETFMAKHTKVKSDFAKNIDGVWADIFWNLRNNIKPQNHAVGFSRDNTDGMMMNVIKVAIANKFAILADNNASGLDELFESQAAKNANPDMRLTFYRYTELGVFNENDEYSTNEEEVLKSNIQSINEAVCLSVYDAFSFIYDIMGQERQKYQICSKIIDIEEQLNNILFYGIDGKNSNISGATYQSRLIFWALSEYCIKYRNAIQGSMGAIYLHLSRWMSFVRNMAESTEINDVNDMQKALKYLNRIFVSMSNGDVIAYLSQINGSQECAPFPQSQINEEILKAQLITLQSSWEDIIAQADNVESWPGRSGYLLFFSGIADKSYDQLRQWSSALHGEYQDLFVTYKDKMDKLLSYLNGTDFKNECLLERAMLSKGCYLRQEDKKSIIYSMMDQSITSRSYSFRQMLQFNGIKTTDDDSAYKEGVVCLKKVLDDPDYNNNDVEKSLQEIIEKSLKEITDWRWPLLVDEDIWHEAVQRFMWIDKETAWVVRKKGGNTNQYETWSYFLFLNLESNGLKYRYFHFGYPRHTNLNFRVGKQMYQLKISHTFGKWQFDMIAVDDDYQPIKLYFEMRKTIFGLMPNNAQSFYKENLGDAVVWAKAMQKCIEYFGEVL